MDGQVVSADDFCPRPRLLKELVGFVRSGQNVVLQGERRMGKTSLIYEALRHVKRHRMVYVDLLDSPFFKSAIALDFGPLGPEEFTAFLLGAGITLAASVKKALNRLAKLKIIYRHEGEYRFVNPFFKRWLLWKNY